MIFFCQENDYEENKYRGRGSLDKMKENWRREENAWRIVVEELVSWRPTTSRLWQELISEKEKSSRFFKHQKEVRVWKYEFWISKVEKFFFSFILLWQTGLA